MVYLEYIKNTFRSHLIYRLNWRMKILGLSFSLILQICLWEALTYSKQDVVSMEYMLSYILLSLLIQSLIVSNTINTVNQHIYSGQIAMDVIKPIKFRRYMFCESIGHSLFSFLFECVPVTVVATLILKNYELWKKIDCFFIVSVLLGVYLYFSIAYFLALTSFWWTQTWILSRFLNDFVSLFSGKLIPLWMFPSILLLVSKWLPFSYIYYVPISMMIDNVSVNQKLLLIGKQLVWCIIFYLLGSIVEHKGMKKLQVQGG